MDPSLLPPLFQGLSEGQVELALRYFRVLEVDFGQVIIHEGDQDPSLVVVADGQLEIRTGDTSLARADRGALVGEMALFALHGVRMATVETLTPATLLVLDREGFGTLKRKGHPIARSIELHALDALILRLRDTTDRIAEAATGTPAEHLVPSPSFLEKVSSLLAGPGLRRSSGVDKLACLNKSPLFQGVEDEVLGELCTYFSEETCRTGTFVCTEGHLGDQMYVVASGKVDVICAIDDDRAEYLAVLDEGEAFGMGALVQEGYPRMASCVAKTPVTVLSLDRGTWLTLVERGDPVSSALRVALIRALIDQLAYANAQLALIDLQKKALTTHEFAPLLRAGVGVEAHGAYLGTPAVVEYDTL